MQLNNEQRNDLLTALENVLADTDASPTRTMDAVMTYLELLEEDNSIESVEGACPVCGTNDCGDYGFCDIE